MYPNILKYLVIGSFIRVFVSPQIRSARTLSWMRRSTSSLPSSVNRELSPGCQVLITGWGPPPSPYLYEAPCPHWWTASYFLISAPPFQDSSKPKSEPVSEPGQTNGASTTAKPAQSTPLMNVAPPTTTNHTPALLSDPIILPYPANDHVFISKSLLYLNYSVSNMVLEITGRNKISQQKLQ